MQRATVYRVFLASPSDVAEERRVARDVIADWNAANSHTRGVVVEAVGYETHTQAQLGDHPQHIINKQLLDRCDFLLAIFWTRLGTPTAEGPSGTFDEIKKFRELKGSDRVLLFLSERSCSPAIDPIELRRLQDFKKMIGDEGLYIAFQDIGDFARKLRQQLDLRFNTLLRDGLQIDRSISVTFPEIPGRLQNRPTLSVYQLSQDASPWMNGATFHRGMEILFEQIRRESSMLVPDLFIGVNQGGTIAAAYLEARLHQANEFPFQMVRTPTGSIARKTRVLAYPEGGLGKIFTRQVLSKIRTAIIVDSQVKSGESSFELMEMCDRYAKKVTIYFAVLVVCGIKTSELPAKIDNRDDLFDPNKKLNVSYRRRCWDKYVADRKKGRERLPDFFAYVSQEAVKPAEGVR